MSISTTSQKVREHIIECSAASGHGHIPTSFSVVEMILAAYARMNHSPQNPRNQDRDVFILSKGHAALGYYCCLAELGYFNWKEVKTFGQAGTRFGCHPDRLKLDAVEVSSGSLGHGIAVGVGMALGFKIRNQSNRVFALVGDGEANEGSVWESTMIAADQKLSNFTILYDHNLSQTRCLQIPNPAERFTAFGCKTFEVDGHSLEEILAAIDAPATTSPKAIICKTIKGYGCSTLVDNVFEWHRRSPRGEEVVMLKKELYAKAV
jgi:transketolase